MHNKIFEILLKQMDGKSLELDKKEYFLFIEDAMIRVYLDEEEKKLKVEVEMFDPENAHFFYRKDITTNDLLGV